MSTALHITKKIKPFKKNLMISNFSQENLFKNVWPSCDLEAIKIKSKRSIERTEEKNFPYFLKKHSIFIALSESNPYMNAMRNAGNNGGGWVNLSQNTKCQLLSIFLSFILLFIPFYLFRSLLLLT